jgi:type IV secretion system protein VirB4
VVCRLDLKGFDDELAVISGRAAEVERVRQLIARVGSSPSDWLPLFHATSIHSEREPS